MVGAAITGSVEISDATVSATSTYTFEMQIDQEIPLGGLIQFEFNEFKVNNARLTCEAVYGFAQDGIVPCTVDEANGTLSLTGAVFPSQEDLLILTVTGLVNPDYVVLSTVRITSYTDTTMQSRIESSGFSNFSFDTVAGALLCVIEAVEPGLVAQNTDLVSSNVVAQNTDITVSFTVTHAVPVDGSFVLEMPKWNAGTQKRGLERSSIHYEQPNTINAKQVPCESASHPNIQCTFTKTPVFESSEIASTRDILSITGLSSEIKAN